MSIEVVHDESRARFVAVLKGEEAVVEYRMPDENTLDLHRTFVPDVARGRGVAGLLVRAALDHARSEGYRVIPTCPYVARFLEKHPEYADLAEA